MHDQSETKETQTKDKQGNFCHLGNSTAINAITPTTKHRENK
jgi:hypothetical protein